MLYIGAAGVCVLRVAQRLTISAPCLCMLLLQRCRCNLDTNSQWKQVLDREAYQSSPKTGVVGWCCWSCMLGTERK